MTNTKETMEFRVTMLEDRISHITSSPETIEQFTKINGKIESLQKEKVNWKQFYWIVGMIITVSMSITTGMWSHLNKKIDKQSELLMQNILESTKTNKDIAWLRNEWEKYGEIKN